jgi:tetratricopeptide (TPR) repeat protein
MLEAEVSIDHPHIDRPHICGIDRPHYERAQVNAIDQTKESRKVEADRLLARLGERQSLDNLGIAYYFLGNYSKAIEYQEQSFSDRP